MEQKGVHEDLIEITKYELLGELPDPLGLRKWIRSRLRDIPVAVKRRRLRALLTNELQSSIPTRAVKALTEVIELISKRKRKTGRLNRANRFLIS